MMENPYFPTFYKGKSATTPGKIFVNKKAYYNTHSSLDPQTTNDHNIVLMEIPCNPIMIPMEERRCPKKTDWEIYKDERGSIEPFSLQGKGIKEIGEAMKRVTNVLTSAIEQHVPKIGYRTFTYPEIDHQMKDLMTEARRLKILMVNGMK